MSTILIFDPTVYCLSTATTAGRTSTFSAVYSVCGLICLFNNAATFLGRLATFATAENDVSGFATIFSSISLF